MPKRRSEFERNMYLLHEGFVKNQVKISKGNIATIKGIRNVRHSPNRRANLLTVNELARLMANGFASMTLDKYDNTPEGPDIPNR